jgi:hypothetical protein
MPAALIPIVEKPQLGGDSIMWVRNRLVQLGGLTCWTVEDDFTELREWFRLVCEPDSTRLSPASTALASAGGTGGRFGGSAE